MALKNLPEAPDWHCVGQPSVQCYPGTLSNPKCLGNWQIRIEPQ